MNGIQYPISGGAAEKMERLRSILRDFGSAAIAFSAGVDSTFLLRIAHEELGDGAVAVTFRSMTFPKSETEEAMSFCRREGVRHVVMDVDPLEIPGFAGNPVDRCYICKRALFERLVAFARNEGLAAVLEGSNGDDDGDYRPGRRAIAELGVRSPLHEAGLAKAEIRALSHSIGLQTASKPSYACLASRFPYGEPITAGGLERVGRAEEWLRGAFHGLRQVRVRSHHGNVARIEVEKCDIGRMAARADEIDAALRSFGFSHVSLDLRGYRTGSLNVGLAAGAADAM